MKSKTNQTLIAMAKHRLIGASLATLLVSGSVIQSAPYFQETFNGVTTADLTTGGWEFAKNDFAFETGTDFGVAQSPFEAANFPSGLVPGADFFNLTTGERLLGPPTADGTTSASTNDPTAGFLISDSDAAGGSDNVGLLAEWWAITPSFSTVGATEVWFHADTDILVNNNGECLVTLDFSVDNGTNWIQAWAQAEPQRPIKAWNFNVNLGNPAFEGGDPIGGYPALGSYSQTKTWSGIHGRWHLKLPASANNQASVKLRIRYIEPADAWWIALDNIVVDNNPPPQGSQVVLSENFESGIPGTWKNLSSPQTWGTGPLTNLDGTLKQTWTLADTREIHVDLLRYLNLLRAGGTNLAPAAVLNWSVTNFTDYPEHQTFHPNNPTDGRLMMMLAGGNYALWQPDDVFNTSDLDSPTLNLSGKSEVFLDFDSEWLTGIYNPLDPTVSQNFLVQVSVDGGTTFSNVFDYQGALSDIGEGSYFMHHYIPVPQAAGKSSVVFRFHAAGIDNGNSGTRHRGFWVIDNVRVTANVLAITSISTSGGNVTVTWPGGPGIRLQKTTNLTNPASWVDIGSTLGNSSHSEAWTATPTYYRLAKPL